MTDLSGKFSAFETKIGTNHTELMAALTSLATALGTVPESPVSTIADIISALTQTNILLAGIRSDMGAQHTLLLAKSSEIALTLDTINNNNALNTTRLLDAIISTACACETTNPLLPPPLSVTPIDAIGAEKCRRIQYYLALFGSWLDKIANYGGGGATVTGGTLGALLGLAVTEAGLAGGEIGAIGGPPGAVLGIILGAIVGAVYTFGASYLFDVATQWHAPTFQHNLLLAMYAANNADEGFEAFSSVVDASGMGYAPESVIEALFWSGWPNDIYSATPVIDDSAFDGSICAPVVVETWPLFTQCLIVPAGDPSIKVIEAIPSDGGPHGFYTSIVWPSNFPRTNGISGTFLNWANSDYNVLSVDLNHYWIWSSVLMQLHNDGLKAEIGANTWYHINQTLSYAIFVFPNGTGEFRLCGPQFVPPS